MSLYMKLIKAFMGINFIIAIFTSTSISSADWPSDIYLHKSTQTAFVSSSRGKVFSINLKTNESKLIFSEKFGITALAPLDGQNQRLIFGGSAGVRIIDLNGNLLRKTDVRELWFESLSPLAGTETFAVSTLSSVRVYGHAELDVASFDTHTNLIGSIAFLSKEKIIGKAEKAILIMSPLTKTFEVYTTGVSPREVMLEHCGGEEVLSYGFGTKFSLYQMQDKAIKAEVLQVPEAGVDIDGVGCDRDWVVIGSTKGMLYVFDRNTKRWSNFKGHNGNIIKVKIFGDSFYTISTDGFFKIWTKEKKLVREIGVMPPVAK